LIYIFSIESGAKIGETGDEKTSFTLPIAIVIFSLPEHVLCWKLLYGNVGCRIYWIGQRELGAYEERSFQQEIDSLFTWGFHSFTDPIGRISLKGFTISPQLSVLNFVYASERQKESRLSYV
jgi:hypothetical protein